MKLPSDYLPINDLETNIINKILKINIKNLTKKDIEQFGFGKNINKPYYILMQTYYSKPCNMFMDLKELELFYMEQSNSENYIGKFEVYDAVTCEKLIINPTITISLEIKKENNNETTK
jgi:hypothetical protein